MILKIYFYIIKINNFRGDLSDISAKKKSLFLSQQCLCLVMLSSRYTLSVLQILVFLVRGSSTLHLTGVGTCLCICASSRARCYYARYKPGLALSLALEIVVATLDSDKLAAVRGSGFDVLNPQFGFCLGTLHVV